MSAPGTRHLKALLDRELRDVSDAALQGGAVDGRGLERLEGLARLIELHHKARRPSLRQRWPIALALLVTLSLVSVLLFARVPVTTVELDVSLSELSFTVPTEQRLTESLSLTRLGVAGLGGLILPRTETEPERALSAEGEELSVRFRAAPGGSLGLAPVTMSAGAQVWLRFGPDASAPQPFYLGLAAQDMALKADLDGAVEVLVAGLSEQPGMLNFTVPRPVALKPRGDGLELSFALADAGQSIVAPQLLASDLSLARVEEFTAPEGDLVRQVSTVLSGALFLEALNGKELLLRPGEGLKLEDSLGEIRALSLDEEALRLQFRGSVRGLSTGLGDSERSLMPTYLEWLQARHGLSLLWGATLYLFGLLVTVIRWWRLPV